MDERRAERRCGAEMPAILKLFPSFDPYRTKEINHSTCGISFEAGVCLKPGAVVYIRHQGCPENCPQGKACESCRTVGLATIKWCNEKGAADLPLYLVGAKYFEYGIGY